MAGATTAINDIPGDVLSLLLRRLDGASLAALGCACSAFRELAADAETWRGLCLTTWPSLRDVVLDECGVTSGGGYRGLFADAFPWWRRWWPAAWCPVDLHHGEICLMSLIVVTDASSEWFLGSPFRVDAPVQEGFSALAPTTPAELMLSWILIDPTIGRAINASSRRPVSIDREWFTEETVARFTVVLGGGGGVTLDATVTCDDQQGHVREVSLCVEDGRRHQRAGRAGCGGHDAEAAARRRYEAFARRRAARKVRKARRDGVVDLFCSGVAAAAFVGLLSTLASR
uniref:F-box domain-containing protein n=1 Tax=Oryza punctata TaxID=4537 RepID=A0A0E0MJU1_ORYPU